MLPSVEHPGCNPLPKVCARPAASLSGICSSGHRLTGENVLGTGTVPFIIITRLSGFCTNPVNREHSVCVLSDWLIQRTLNFLILLSSHRRVQSQKQMSAAQEAALREHFTFISWSVWVYKNALTMFFILNVFSSVSSTIFKFVDALKHIDYRIHIIPELNTR